MNLDYIHCNTILPPARAAPSLVFWHMDRYMHFLNNGYMHFFVNRNVLVHRYRYVFVDWNLFHMMMMNGVNVVWDMNDDVLTVKIYRMKNLFE